MYLVVPPGGCFRETRRIELGPQPLTIGRSEGCDVRVDVPGVDQEHAKISEISLIAMGPDCAVGDVPLDPGARRLLSPGDEIQIGSVVVVVEGADPAATAPASGSAPRAPRVRVVEGQNFGEELSLDDEGREYVLGRQPKCDLVLEDREVSREHVRVFRRGYSVFVIDLSSTRGSWMGRSAVYTGATVEWTAPRMLRVGATVLALDLPEEIRKVAPPSQASAPMTPPPRPRKGAPSSRRLSPAPPPAVDATSSAPTARLPAFHYDPTPAPAPVPTPGAPARPAPPESSPVPISIVPPAPTRPRTAWKRTGPTIGTASGLLLLALAGLAVLGALFVVFSLLE